MKEEKMLKYMNLLDDKYILEASPSNAKGIRRNRRASKMLLRYGALVASLVICIGVWLIIPHLKTGSPAIPSDTNGQTDNFVYTDEIMPPETHTRPDTHRSDVATDVPIGGDYMGDELISPYVAIVDMVTYSKGTFSENYGRYMSEFDEMEGKWENNRPSVMYHLSKAMNLTREDLEEYFVSLDIQNVPENIYAGLLADSVEESMQLLKSKYAFYCDGKLYTVYDVYSASKTLSDKNPVDFTDEEYDQVWLNIDEYLDSPYAYDVGEGIRTFVDEMVNVIEIEEE